MKKLAVIAVAALALTSSLQARINETVAQIENRFGAGQFVGREGGPDSPRFRYRLRGMKIDVQFRYGKAAWELFHADSRMGKGDLDYILNLNGAGYGWNFNERTGEWVRQDGRIRVSHFEGRPNEIYVQRVD